MCENSASAAVDIEVIIAATRSAGEEAFGMIEEDKLSNLIELLRELKHVEKLNLCITGAWLSVPVHIQPRAP